MEICLLDVFYICFGSGVYNLARHYIELETMPLGMMSMFAMAGIALWLYGICKTTEDIYDIIRKWKNGKS